MKQDSPYRTQFHGIFQGCPLSPFLFVVLMHDTNMKMQNEIQAPISGTVISVSCEEGQAIEANVPLVVIEPDETEEEV